MARQRKSTRRQFLKQATAVTAGAIGFPYIIPSSALGKDGATAPSERIVMGAIGTGGQGRGDMGALMSHPDCQYVAVCDVDAGNLQQAQNQVNGVYNNQDCKGYKDLRELLAHKDIDAVTVTTPDHWHAVASVYALNAGKDVYCEKPLANSIYEGRAICDAAKKNNKIVQTGSQERSGDNARHACELILNGRIGKLHTIHINLPCTDGHHQQARMLNTIPPEEPVPAGFDYDTWLGHTPKAPYSPRRTHFWWRFILAYGGGEMTDRGAHVIDIGQMGNGTDRTGPVEIEASGKQTPGSLYNAFWDYTFTNTFANGVKMVGGTKEPRGVKFEGADGWINVEIHGGALSASKPELLQEKIKDTEIQLGRSPGHHRNFLDCVKSRKQPVAEAEIGHRSASLCHLNNIAMLVGRKLQWDPEAEKFKNDDEANKLLRPPMREPWVL